MTRLRRSTIHTSAVVVVMLAISNVMNAGIQWDCPWTFTVRGCDNGTVTCKCPGTGADVKYTIGCCNQRGLCGVMCNGNDCSRFNNCNECRSGTDERSHNSCLSCKQGFLMGDGTCTQDLNECSILNGGCDQICVNSYGTYYCQCYDGFRLLGDQHSCQNIDECSSSPCLNGGNCSDQVNGYSCACLPGYTGSNCGTGMTTTPSNTTTTTTTPTATTRTRTTTSIVGTTPMMTTTILRSEFNIINVTFIQDYSNMISPASVLLTTAISDAFFEVLKNTSTDDYLANVTVAGFRNDGYVHAVSDLHIKHSPSADPEKLRGDVYNSVTSDFNSKNGHFRSHLHSDCASLTVANTNAPATETTTTPTTTTTTPTTTTTTRTTTTTTPMMTTTYVTTSPSSIEAEAMSWLTGIFVPIFAAVIGAIIGVCKCTGMCCFEKKQRTADIKPGNNGENRQSTSEKSPEDEDIKEPPGTSGNTGQQQRTAFEYFLSFFPRLNKNSHPSSEGSNGNPDEQSIEMEPRYSTLPKVSSPGSSALKNNGDQIHDHQTEKNTKVIPTTEKLRNFDGLKHLPPDDDSGA